MVSCALRSDKLKGAIHKRNFWIFFILHTFDGYRLNFDIFLKIEKSSVKTLLDRDLYFLHKKPFKNFQEYL